MGQKTEKIAKNFFDLEARDIDGQNRLFQEFKGSKAFIVVNVACNCAYTADHYKQLVELHNTYSEKGLCILGFPCNQFGAQEPNAEPQIKQFVKKEYGTNFQLFSKIYVNGPKTHPVYKYLKANTKQHNTKSDIPWNFGKFLLDADGNVIDFYEPQKKPSEMIPTILELLGEKQ